MLKWDQKWYHSLMPYLGTKQESSKAYCKEVIMRSQQGEANNKYNKYLGVDITYGFNKYTSTKIPLSIVYWDTEYIRFCCAQSLISDKKSDQDTSKTNFAWRNSWYMSFLSDRSSSSRKMTAKL